MLKLITNLDIQRDVRRLEETEGGNTENTLVSEIRVLNVERDESVLYSWREATGTTRVSKYSPHTKQNKLLYTFDREVSISSASVNREETLLAVSVTSSTNGGEGRFNPVPKYLTLVIEIHPANNTKVLKAVDCRVEVQFLYPLQSKVQESHLIVAAGDGYVDQYHILMGKQDGNRVVMQHPERLLRDRVVEDFCWIQWDSDHQRLFYLMNRDKHMLKCVQFFPDHNFETLFELPLDLPGTLFTSVRFVNFGLYRHSSEEDRVTTLVVFTDRAGMMCVCYSPPLQGLRSLTYTIAFVHKGFKKTFNVAKEETAGGAQNPRLSFIHLGCYIMVHVAGHFLHLINCRQQDLLCHSLFLSGDDTHVDVLGADGVVVRGCRIVDVQTGRFYSAELDHDFLLQLLSCSRPEAQRLAALHCLLLYLEPEQELQKKIIDWISENIMSFQAFDQIQEFILASLYRTCYDQSISLDPLLPYSSVFEKTELPVALTAIPGVKCTPELLVQPVIKGKTRSLLGYWDELHWVIERIKYYEVVPNPRYRFSQIRKECKKLQLVLNSEKKKSNFHQHLDDNTKNVLSLVDAWCLDMNVVPLFQEEDQHQRILIGLTVEKLREHLNRNLPRLGRKKVEMLVVNYVAKLLELVRFMLESMWKKLKLSSTSLNLEERGSEADFTMFHLMCRILEAAEGLGLPLPPGFSSLLTLFGVRCLPHHTFLQYVDHGFLQLTEPFVSRLLTGLNNSDENEALKFSVVRRLPEYLVQRMGQLWDHPISSASISRTYVKALLEKRGKSRVEVQMDREKMCFTPNFLPLTYLTSILSNIQDRALNPFKEQHVDARFVEETALRQTLIQLGFDRK